MSDALRIACFVPAFPELSETFILRQIVGLLDRGHDVRIFAYAPASGGLAHEVVQRRGLMDRVRVIGDVATAGRRSAGPSGRATTGAWLRCLRPSHARGASGWGALVRTLAALRGEAPFDIVHCHYGVTGLRFGVAASLWSAPLVTSFYGYDASRYPRERGTGVFAPLFAQADAVVSLSRHMDDRLVALGCPRELLRRVPLSVEPADDERARAPAPSPDGIVRLLSVARLVEKKGIEHALRAVALVHDELPQVRYDVVGDGPLRGELEALSAQLGVSDRVRFLGALTPAEVERAMRAADLFVLPSVTARTGDEEGTPTVLLEAAYAGLPVVATRHAGIPDVVADGVSGLLVDERDTEALADALRALVRDPERRAAMGAAGRRLVVERGHLVPDVAARLEALYLELRRRPRRAR